MSSIAEQTRTGDVASPTANTDGTELLKIVIDSLEASKAEELVTVDLAGKSSLGDYMVIASGTSSRHVSSISEKLVIKLKETGYGNSRVEGLKNADWVLIDASDVIIHIFRPEVRDFYNLEKIWVDDESQDQAVT